MRAGITFLSVLTLGFMALSSQLSAAPANDLFVNRTQLNGTNVTVSGNNSGAGEEAGEDIGPGNVLWV
jgi:hypothetical protein